MDGDAVSGHDGAYTLPVASLRMVATVQRPIALPPYAGSTLRGAFGHALRQAGCLYRSRGAPCEACVENQAARAANRPTRCVYGYLFETPSPPGAPLLERQQDVPHPYVIRPADEGRIYPSGATLAFEVQLFGLAIHCVGHVVEACIRMARRGLGPGRGTAEVCEVWEQAPFGTERRPLPVPADRSALTLIAGWDAALAGAHRPGAGAVALQFLTPTRLVRAGVPVPVPEFATLARALLRRLTVLALFHGGEVPAEYFALLASHAEEVRLVAWQGAWHDWERYSSRQERRMTFGGLVGTALYEGDLVPFLPYLVYGQAIHVGKACTFGGGRYRVVGAGSPGT